MKTAILDGVYLAHQGRLAAGLGLRAFLKVQKNGGEMSKAMKKACLLMGLREEDLAEFSLLYRGASEDSMRANLIENYTYRVNEAIRDSETEVHLWRGSREPYAGISHAILKKRLRHWTERIWPDAGHGVMLYFHTDEYLDAVRAVLEERA